MAATAQSLTELRLRTSAKWRAYPADVLPLFVAEMDFPLAEPIAATLHDAIRRSDTGYAYDSPELSESFTGFAARRWGWIVDPDQVRTTADVSMGIVEVLRQVTNPGDSVVITPPVYPPFFELVAEAGTSVREVSLLGDLGTGWALDLDGLEAAFAGGATAFVLCNPHNPLGHPHTRAQLEAVADLAARYGTTVISDEIHGPLTHNDGHYIPFLSVSDAARDHGVAITSASKGWNLAGLKCALMVTASARMRSIINGMPDEVFWRTSILGVQASIAAFRDSEQWLDEVIESLEVNRRLLSSMLSERMPGARYREPRASYLAWLDLRSSGWGDDPAAGILRQAKVALTSGPTFGAQGTGFARLNFGCSPEVLIEAIDRIAAIRL
jgi:cystathionine beta-lyase